MLVMRASTHNDRVGISGILILFRGHFIQVLEGPGAAVGELYTRIGADSRHRNVVTVQDTPIEARAYGDWGMRQIRDEDLGEAERALIFHALQVTELHTPIEPKTRMGDTTSTTFMNLIMARAFPAKLPMEVSPEVSSLLYAAEVVLARDLVLSDEMLEKLAQDANVGVQTARIYFPTMTDLIRACVRRIVAREHQAFLAEILTKRFDDKAELAGFITDFVIKNHDRTAVSHRFADQFAQHGSDLTTQTAWIIAKAAIEAAPREGWPFPDLDTTTLAAAIGATDGAARILARHDFVSLAEPATRM